MGKIACMYHFFSNIFLPNSKKYAVLTGLNTRQSVAVTFHCILPKLLWHWDKDSRMYMRFEGYTLGNWQNDVGEFNEGRYVIGFLCSKSELDLFTGSWKKV